MTDTTAEAAAIARSAIQRVPPCQRIRDALAHSDAMRELALSRLRLTHPGRSTLELAELLRGRPLITDAPARNQ